MKKDKNPYPQYLIFSLLLIFSEFQMMAQDRIYKSDNTIIEARVTEITDTDIKYHKYSNLNGPIYIIAKTEVHSIEYENGDSDVFSNIVTPQNTLTSEIIITDSLQFIELMWGVKLENRPENGGVVAVSEIRQNSVFKSFAPIPRLRIFKIENGNDPMRIFNTSQLCRVLFETYNSGVTKVKLTSESRRMSNIALYSIDPKGFDISALQLFAGSDSIKKLSIEESKNAGLKVSKIYHPKQFWGIQGFTIGMLIGVPSVAAMGIAGAFQPITPQAPPHVDTDSWTKAYRSQIKKKRIISGIIGSMLGSALVIGAYSSIN